MTDDAIVALTRAFERNGIRWYLFGAHATIVYGVPRMTADVDATADVPLADDGGLMTLLEASGFVPRVADVGAPRTWTSIGVRRLLQTLGEALDRSDLLPHRRGK